jgi:hypothetical protein
LKNKPSNKSAWKQASRKARGRIFFAICFHSSFLLGLFFNPESGGNMRFRNICWLSTDYSRPHNCSLKIRDMTSLVSWISYWFNSFILSSICGCAWLIDGFWIDDRIYCTLIQTFYYISHTAIWHIMFSVLHHFRLPPQETPSILSLSQRQSQSYFTTGGLPPISSSLATSP